MTTRRPAPAERLQPYRPHCHCGASWGGSAACHCSACHETFTAITSFDKHRRHGACLRPIAAGLIDRGGMWGWPGANPVYPARDDG
jgi:hypothetical protein